MWGAGGRDLLGEELEKRGGFWILGRQVQGEEETRREVYCSMSSQQCAVFQGLQSSLCPKSPKSVLKANNGSP